MTLRFQYLSPLIIPVLPAAAGSTILSFNIASALRDAAPDVREGHLDFRIERFEAGASVAEEDLQITIADGRPDPPIIDRTFVGDQLGYAQVSISADRPIFRTILTQHVYSLIERPDGGTFILNASYKFSDPLIIDLMRRVGRFCLVHPGHYVSSQRGAGNSALIVNPFDGPIVARLATVDGSEVRKRVAHREAVMIPLEELIEEDRLACVLYSGSNRYPAWDVRHAFGRPNRINRIDHLEFFRGDPTESRLPPWRFLRRTVGAAVRSVRMGL